MVNPQVLLKEAPNKRFLLLGNEAIVRGALEAGVKVVTTYPGTPSSEIADVISRIAKKAGIYMEYSANEMVALEVVAGASICGLRSMASMKHVGLNVAADALMTLAYTGIRGGLIIITADDPGCYSSQNEQDNRYYALFANLPCLEPSNAQEAKDMVPHAMQISEELELPVLIRTTMRVNHTRGPVSFNSLCKKTGEAEFVKDTKRFVMMPAFARLRHMALLEKMSHAGEISEKSPFNKNSENGEEMGIITSGAAYNYAIEAVNLLKCDVAFLKLGMTNPFPERLVSNFLNQHKMILVVEELEPYLEIQTRALTKDCSFQVKIYGKLTKHLPRHGEFSTRLVIEALAKILEKPLPINFKEIDRKYDKIQTFLPSRPPTMCPGCPHRASAYAIKIATKGKVIYTTDIGCYALAALPPIEVGDVLVCMGASVGLACGISQALDKTVVAMVGDSTFFHAAIPGLINAVYNDHKLTLIVLDNCTTAMTGHQPHPGTGVTGMGKRTRLLRIEELAKGCGVDFVKVVNPYDLKETVKVIKKAVNHPKVAVVVCRQRCPLLVLRDMREKRKVTASYEIDGEKCVNCQVCVKAFGCPSIYLEGDRVSIDKITCIGCGVCAQICPYNAIKVGKEGAL